MAFNHTSIRFNPSFKEGLAKLKFQMRAKGHVPCADINFSYAADLGVWTTIYCAECHQPFRLDETTMEVRECHAAIPQSES